MNIVIPYRRAVPDDELRYALRSYQNLSHDGLYIIGDMPVWVKNASHIVPDIPRWVRYNPYHDVEFKIYSYVKDHPEDFIISNDDFVCTGQPLFFLWNDDSLNDIMRAYEECMSSQSVREEEVLQGSLPSSLHKTVEDWENRWRRIDEGSFIRWSYLLGERMPQDSETEHLLSYAQPTVEALWRCRRAWETARGSWNEMDKDLQDLAKHEAAMLKPKDDGIQKLWGQGDKSKQRVGQVQQFPKGHGRSSTGHVDREGGQQQGVLKNELYMDNSNRTEQQYSKEQIHNISRANSILRTMGEKDWGKLLDYIKSGKARITTRPDIIAYKNKRYQVDVLFPYHKGTIEDHIKRRKRNDSFTTALKHTLDFLRKQGIKDPLDYSMHIPMIMNGKKRKEMSELIQPEMRKGLSFTTRSIYGNLYNVGGEYMKDVKSTDNFNQTFLSTNDPALVSPLGKFIRSKFTVPSQYEV